MSTKTGETRTTLDLPSTGKHNRADCPGSKLARKVVAGKHTKKHTHTQSSITILSIYATVGCTYIHTNKERTFAIFPKTVLYLCNTCVYEITYYIGYGCDNIYKGQPVGKD